MKNNIFEGAKFGDKFLTRDGKIAIYNCYVNNPLSYEIPHHELLIQGARGVYDVSDNGKDIYSKELSINDIVSKYQEQIDEKELYELAYHHSMNNGYENLNEDEIITGEYKLTWGDIIGDIEKAFKAGYHKAKEELI